MKPFTKSAALVFVLAIAIVQLAHADIFLKQKRHTDSITIMGQTQPAKDVVSKIWITPEGIRRDAPEESTIMWLDEQKLIHMNHSDKTYQVHPMDMNEMMQEAGQGQSPEEKAAMQGMMKNMMKMEVSVEATDETQTIRDWKCRKYLLSMDTMMGRTVSEVWATEDLKVDKKLYDRLNTAMMANMPGIQKAIKDIRKEIEKIKGVQVKTVSKQEIMGKTRTTTTELLTYKEADAPANLLDIPDGYQEKGQY